MTEQRPTPPSAGAEGVDFVSLAIALRGQAKGAWSELAAAELLIGHVLWLARKDFRQRCVHLTNGRPLRASIDWAAALSALDAGDLPCTPDEGKVLRIAAGLAGCGELKLLDTIRGLDPQSLRLVLAALAHASGRPGARVVI